MGINATEATTYLFDVSGMTCGGCARVISKVLVGNEQEAADPDFVKHIARAQVDVNKKKLTVVLRPDAQLSAEELITLLENKKPKFSFTLDRDPFAMVVDNDSYRRRFLNAGLAGLATLAMKFLPLFIVLNPFTMAMVMAGVTAVVMATAGWYYYRNMWFELRDLTPGMDSLIALSTLSAFILSVALLAVGSTAALHFMPVLVILGTVNLGHGLRHWLNYRINRALPDLRETFHLFQPRQACVDDQWLDVGKVHKGTVIKIARNQRVPITGEITAIKQVEVANIMPLIADGELLRTSHFKVGDTVSAGDLNLGADIELKTTVREFGFSLYPKLGFTLPQDASHPWVNKISKYFVVGVIAIGLLTAVGWLLAGAGTVSIIHAMTVLIVACPCSLGLAEPLSRSIALHLLANKKLYVRQAHKLTRLSKADTIVFDKTGTLTLGKYQVTQFMSSAATKYSVDDIKCWVASLEQSEQHPLAKALVADAGEIKFAKVKPLELTTEGGVAGEIDGKQVVVGNLKFVTAYLQDKSAIDSRLLTGETKKTFVVIDGHYQGYYALQELGLRENAHSVIAQLKANGFKILMLTGDEEVQAKRTAELLAIGHDCVFANRTQADKANFIADLKAQGKTVVMVGDGLNDAKAMNAADFAVAVAMDNQVTLSADATLSNDLRDLPRLLAITRALNSNIYMNLALAFAYNPLMITLAALGLLNPVVAAVCMALSSIMVVSSALSLWPVVRGMLTADNPFIGLQYAASHKGLALVLIAVLSASAIAYGLSCAMIKQGGLSVVFYGLMATNLHMCLCCLAVVAGVIGLVAVAAIVLKPHRLLGLAWHSLRGCLPESCSSRQAHSATPGSQSTGSRANIDMLPTVSIFPSNRDAQQRTDETTESRQGYMPLL